MRSAGSDKKSPRISATQVRQRCGTVHEIPVIRTCGKALDGMLGELRKLTPQQEGV